MRNLINIKDLSKDDILAIYESAKKFKNREQVISLKDKSLALMFFENSTRTKVSFEMAAKKLDMKVFNFDITSSSINKGESYKDTIENLYFIGINAIVARTRDEKFFDDLLPALNYPMTFINAGLGKLSHPTQALLDFMTMKEKSGDIENKKVVIVGDIEHSRVAKSNIALLSKFGVNVTVCAPENFKPKKEIANTTFVSGLKEAISGADVVMGLRIQKERIEEEFSEDFYIHNYQISSKLLDKYAPNAILMHPGPVNRDIELTAELIDSKRGRTILEQAQNGVYTRMAVLNFLMGENK